MTHEARKRLKWVQAYYQCGHAGRTCLKCGISRPTLRKWLSRYEKLGAAGLENESRRPRNVQNKVTPEQEELIVRLRKNRRLGHRRMQSVLKRSHGLRLSLATIHRILHRNRVAYLKPARRRKKSFKRYSRPIPGDRIQMDTCKIAPGLFQYTAVDDCSRYRVLKLYRRRTAANTLAFLDCVAEEMPFPVQRIQTDRGREFFAVKVQKRLMEWGIKFRPVKPRSPQLNGKVERSQKTDLIEFYPDVDLRDSNLPRLLDEWQHHYNWERPHSSLDGKTPIEKICSLLEKTPISEEIEALYDSQKERIQNPDYKMDRQLRKLKLSG